MGHPNLLLKQARDNVGLSQEDVAKELRIGVKTYSGWECGYHIPYPRHRRALAPIFKLSVKQVNALFHHADSPSSNDDTPDATIELKDTSYDSKGMNQSLEDDLNQRLLGIVDAGTYANQCKEFTLITEQFDAMNTKDDERYQMTRRQAVRNLAAFPFAPPINLKKRDSVSPSNYELFLQECGASLTACNELSLSNDPDDLEFAFQCVCRYLVELKVICNSFSRYRQQALELAAVCAIQKKTLGYARASRATNSLFAQDAVDLSLESENICLILSAYKKQARDYERNNQRKLALDTATRARNLLEQHERQQGRLPACIRGGTQSTLSLIQARNGLSFDMALKKAGEQDPGDEDPYVMLYTRVWVPMDQGKTLYYAGKTAKALAAYEQLIDPETLTAREPFKETLNETWRVKTILGMAQASMKGAARNKGNAIRYWEEAIEGAKRMKHKSLCSEVITVHDLMDAAFPDEKEIHNLLDHFKNMDKSLL